MPLRDILIFPKFNNIDAIQAIRKKYDRLYDKLNPHITLVFPFVDDISDDELIKEVEKILSEYQKFLVRFKGVSLSNDNYLFLNCLKGKEEIISLHDALYSGNLSRHLRKDIPYVPHVTLGQSNTNILSDFDEEFIATIDEVCIEKMMMMRNLLLLRGLNYR